MNRRSDFTNTKSASKLFNETNTAGSDETVKSTTWTHQSPSEQRSSQMSTYSVSDTLENQNKTTNSTSNEANNNLLLTKKIIELIRAMNLKLIAFDFDCTIVNIHTGGQWLDSAGKLSEFVRPCFRELLPVLLQTPEINVCVVTYSPQEKLIREVLRISLKDEFENVDDWVNKIVIKGNTKAFIDQHGAEACYSNGKQIHLSYCRNFFQSQRLNNNGTFNKMNEDGYVNTNFISDRSILLIDDDLQNVQLAIDNGHLGFQVQNNVKLIDFYEFLIEKYENAKR